jgi:hypothetical protein
MVAGYRQEKIQNFTPEQMQLFQSLFSNVQPGSYLARLAGGDESLFQGMEGKSMREFQGLQGDIASRFSGTQQGQMSARGGSGFHNTLNQATSDFAQDLQSRRQQLQMEAIQQLMGLSGDLLQQRPFETKLIKKKKSFWQQLLEGGLPILGGIAGGLLGGPPGAAAGAAGASGATNALAGASGRSAGVGG